MLDRSVRCALWLKSQGIGSKDVISVATHNHLNTIIPILATCYVGNVLNTFDVTTVDESNKMYNNKNTILHYRKLKYN